MSAALRRFSPLLIGAIVEAYSHFGGAREYQCFSPLLIGAIVEARERKTVLLADFEFQSPLDWGNCRSAERAIESARSPSCFSPLLIGAIVEAPNGPSNRLAVRHVSVPS